MSELLRSKHAFGSREKVNEAIASGKVDAYDILFMDGENESPSIGWIDKNGNPVYVEMASEELQNKMDELESEVGNKASMEDIDDKINQASAEIVNSANDYTDEKIAEIVRASSFEIVEF